MRKRPHTLVINRSDSRCGNCGKPADPHEERHLTVRYWQAVSDGCGQRFVMMTSDYVDSSGQLEAACKRMRPDLVWFNQYGKEPQ